MSTVDFIELPRCHTVIGSEISLHILQSRRTLRPFKLLGFILIVLHQLPYRKIQHDIFRSTWNSDTHYLTIYPCSRRQYFEFELGKSIEKTYSQRSLPVQTLCIRFLQITIQHTEHTHLRPFQHWPSPVLLSLRA